MSFPTLLLIAAQVAKSVGPENAAAAASCTPCSTARRVTHPPCEWPHITMRVVSTSDEKVLRTRSVKRITSVTSPRQNSMLPEGGKDTVGRVGQAGVGAMLTHSPR